MSKTPGPQKSSLLPGLASRPRLGVNPWVFLILFLALTGSVARGVAPNEGLTLELRSTGLRASPPLPDPTAFPVQLVLDDDQSDGVFGFGGASARQFLWFNAFANPGAFDLQEIWVLYPAGMDVPMGGAVQLAVFLDPDGDPTNGAELLATYDGVIQANDGDTFSLYPLPTPLSIPGSGSVLIGVVNRFFVTGVDPPPTQPAAVDTTLAQNQSYFALWPGDAPDPPDLGSATTIDLLAGALPGNFMIRGFGRQPTSVAIPAQGTWGLVMLGVLMAMAAVWALRRR